LYLCLLKKSTRWLEKSDFLVRPLIFYKKCPQKAGKEKEKARIAQSCLKKELPA
jgi:hypothetical protein